MNYYNVNRRFSYAIAWLCVTVSLWLQSSLLHAGADAAKQIAAPEKTPAKVEQDFKKPAWLTELSFTVKEMYDSDVFLTNVDGPTVVNPRPKLANVSSWVTSVNPKVAINFVPLLNLSKDDTSVQALSFTYSPDIYTFHNASSEDYAAHQTSFQAKGKDDDFSYSLDNDFNYIDGNHHTIKYNTFSCWASVMDRGRKAQFNDKGKISLRYDIGDWFVRPTASMLYYDMQTELWNPVGQYTGWQNYCDRYDLNGGFDVGYKITPDVSTFIGYRFGHQDQQAFDWSGVSNQNDYNRVLAGFEGKPLKWLKFTAQAGPSFHEYNMDTMQSGHEKSITNLYYEVSASAEITSVDTLTLKAYEYQWESSTGLTTYEEKFYDLNYKHKFMKELTANGGIRIWGADYNPPTVRTDWMYIYSTGLQYDIDAHYSIRTDYSYSRGENDVSLNVAPGREFDRHQISISVKASL